MDERSKIIGEVLATVAVLWYKIPELRLCQRIGNCFEVGDNYHKSDIELLKKLGEFYPMLKDDKKELAKMIKEIDELENY